MTGVLVRRRRPSGEAMWYRGRGWRDAATSQGCQSRTTRSWERGLERILPQGLWKEPALPTPWSWTWVSRLWESIFCYFKPPSLWFLVSCVTSPRKLTPVVWRLGWTDPWKGSQCSPWRPRVGGLGKAWNCWERPSLSRWQLCELGHVPWDLPVFSFSPRVEVMW